ncbi:hypothetical protein [Motiliproteus sp. MSK22-1]|uniref:hypothetical protein n=1 Tax=Motiliproteus sp. MSK22-1 TaxID=1897630 RepID=UPI000977D826|nr:hypothetical protein [Motiliproteus sp. MSK22-1]OMH29456.1 hypothetical protein BGP75_19595 [Motiliproteus sp. MSK22-1]
MIIEPDFATRISHLDIDGIDCSTDSIYLLDEFLNIAGYNQYYLQFATENGAKHIEERYGLGKSVLSAISGDLKIYYRNSYTNALRNNSVFVQDYQCSSCDKFRLFHQTAYPIHGRVGLVLTNHCVIERDVKDSSVRLGQEHYNLHGFVVQCSNCRKIQNHSKLNKWDWIPEALEQQLPNTSHSLCLHCLDHYYPDLD